MYSSSSRGRKLQPAAMWRDQAAGLVLRQDENAAEIAVDAVGQGEVDDAIQTAERHGRLGAIAGQRLQSVPLPPARIKVNTSLTSCKSSRTVQRRIARTSLTHSVSPCATRPRRVGHGECSATRAGRPRPALPQEASSSRKRVWRARAALSFGFNQKAGLAVHDDLGQVRKTRGDHGRPAAIASSAAQTPPPCRLGTHTISARCKRGAVSVTAPTK